MNFIVSRPRIWAAAVTLLGTAAYAVVIMAAL